MPPRALRVLGPDHPLTTARTDKDGWSRVRHGRAVRGAAPGPVDDSASAAAIRAYRTAYPRMSEAAARAAFAGQLARKSVQLAAAADSATYGGAWFDPPSGMLHIAATTGGANENAAAVADRLGVHTMRLVDQMTHAGLSRSRSQ